jgi:hypothetical protein
MAMKKCISLFSLFFILYSSDTFAGTTTLISYYPPPSAAYNQVSLSTNYTAPVNTQAAYCPGNNSGIFIDKTGTLYQCTGANSSQPYCKTAANGTVVVDNYGNLHVCKNAGGVVADSIFPQQCYNAFCSYDLTYSAGPCTPSCQNGFTSQGFADTFQTSPSTSLVSIACCSQ